jgi:hypothetical protein
VKCGRPGPLAGYDAQRYGSLLGVSDEGSAVATIIEATYASAKAVAAGGQDPEVLELIVDGERMSSGGEAPIGPQQYDMITRAADRAYCTTNVSRHCCIEHSVHPN